MRNAFIQTLWKLARKDKRIMLLTGDLGFSVLEEFMEDFPDQFINAGVAEQNMTGIAAGLAMEGKIPFIYSIIPFVTMRNFEQIRNDVCYQRLNVKIVGIGAGFSYGPYGHTHHALEDIGILRTLPEMTIIAPGDPVEARLATKAILSHKGPCYLRLGKAGEPALYDKDPDFQIGKGIILRNGKDVTIIATSTMLSSALETASELEKDHIKATVVSMHTIKPLDEKIILECAKKTKVMVTVEEHSVIGGLGSAISEVLAEHNISIPYKRIGVPDRFTECIGLQEYMRHANNLSVRNIVLSVSKLIAPKTSA